MKKPSISELLQLLDKPALFSWANKQGLKGIDLSTQRKIWLSKGTKKHKEIELFHKDGTPFKDQNTQANYEKFIIDKNIISIEDKIETDYFTGRIDCVFEYNNKVYIADYKSSKSNTVYFENKLQLVAYSMAYECDCLAIISMPSFTLLDVNIKDKEPYERIIKSLSNIYYQKQIIDAQ